MRGYIIRIVAGPIQVAKKTQMTRAGTWFILMLMLVSQPKFGESKPTARTLKSPDFAKCHNISRNLISVVSKTLLQKKFEDLNCTYKDVSAYDITRGQPNTLTECLHSTQNKNSTCREINRSALDEKACLSAINSDLRAFNNELQGLNPSINEHIKDLMKALNVQENEEKEVTKYPCQESECVHDMCSYLLAFNLRTVTISRVLNFIKDEPKHHNMKKL
ncbi:interleukin-12 subunit alpha [Pelobates cultripes]|uniref:Interleukin-12 subunit alpha n=1 Tax=Pelobates cultripes TaxID=61616 RepID=A0AAD1RDW3_PELCU|nr:interleukin-12 subunit alpha [Pelobates cultripes]